MQSVCVSFPIECSRANHESVVVVVVGGGGGGVGVGVGVGDANDRG